MSSTQEIYNEMFAGKTVTIRCANFKEFESLRTALCKKNQIPRALEMTDSSVVGMYHEDLGTASFKLTQSNKKMSENRWEIVATSSEDGSA